VKYNYWFILVIIILVGCKKNKHQVQASISNVPDALVTAVYPEQNILPENILKFYIQFSEPMREGDFLKHIQLLDSKGTNLKGVFFDNLYELWTTDHKQLTILVDPGRVKTGLRQNIKQGRAFTVDENYTLTIDKTWKTISGKYLSKTYTKKFTIKEEDVEPPSIKDVVISKIKVDSKTPIILTFNEVMDVFQLKYYVRVISNNTILKGKFKVFDKGKTMQFTPENRWKEDNYQLQIDVRLEDIAANSFAGKFDQAISEAKNFQQKGYVYKKISIE